MLARSSVTCTFLRMLLLALLLGTFGCASSATYIQAKVTDNPLDRVAQQAQEDWTVERVDANTLRMSDVWPIVSFIGLGYSASHANLFYAESDSVLNIQYYLQSYRFLGFPFSYPSYYHAEPDIFAGAFKPTMNGQINDILRWSGASVISRCAGEITEPFPKKCTTASPPN
jgi:hypothetical protein